MSCGGPRNRREGHPSWLRPRMRHAGDRILYGSAHFEGVTTPGNGVGEVGNGRGQATHSFRCDLVSTEDSFVLSFILFPLGLRGSCVQQKTSHG